ncbi:MAG: cobalamin biosynthesis protein CobD [Ruminiclostridium sp.]|nr:cobalamin biosynthesis protein CobD [Ruminiclostridium sp.]
MKLLIPVLPLVIGFLLDALIGDPYRLPHPIRLIGRLISALERFVRAQFANLTAGGFFLAAAVLIISTAVPSALLFLCYSVSAPLGAAVESVMCFYMLAARSLCNESMKVFRAVSDDDTEAARKAVSMIVGRDTAVLDRSGIIRAAVETVAENTSDGVTAPIMYMAVFGAAGGFFYKAANTMDSMIGYRNIKYEKLGKAAARLDDILNYLPSRLTALVMIAAAFILGLDGKNAFRIWRRDRRKHASPNSAQTESVCAGALGVRLAGDAWYFGELHRKPYIGDDTRPIENEDIRRANRLMYVTSVIVLLVFSALRAVIIGGLLT